MSICAAFEGGVLYEGVPRYAGFKENCNILVKIIKLEPTQQNIHRESKPRVNADI